MRQLRLDGSALLVAAGLVLSACGTATHDANGSDPGEGGGGMDGGDWLDARGPSFGSTDASDSGGVACPDGLKCNVPCAAGTSTTVVGKVYDPAGKNPLYNVAVYVPAVPLLPLAKGVPVGQDACECSALYKSGALVSATTDVDGSFTLNNVPVGSEVPLVIQIGKWRHKTLIATTACATTTIADKTLKLPSTVVAADTDDNMPDIAVSTGGLDSLECLLFRMGLPRSEYTPGAGGAGHVHIFTGGAPAGADGVPGAGTFGMSVPVPMPGAPSSYSALWNESQQLMPYDMVLMSCEGGEAEANPAALEAYLNAGGRAFASHYHYTWFAGSLDKGPSDIGYVAPPSEWGANLATWSEDGTFVGPQLVGGTVETTLNGSSSPFPKGLALEKWLGNVGALGVGLPVATEVPIASPRYNARVGPTNHASQSWIASDSTGLAGASMYFSFDTPVNATPPPDGGSPTYCGRGVYSDLHVGAGDISQTTSTPTSCHDADLSPQEKVLEFMLFDLSSCVTSNTVAPSNPVPPRPR